MSGVFSVRAESALPLGGCILRKGAARTAAWPALCGASHGGPSCPLTPTLLTPKLPPPHFSPPPLSPALRAHRGPGSLAESCHSEDVALGLFSEPLLLWPPPSSFWASAHP